MDKLSSDQAEARMADKDYIDPKGYWAFEGDIRRMGDEDGQQEVIIKRTNACSEAEWKRVCEALISVKSNLTTTSRTLPQFRIDHNRVIIS
jgi:hypothetical protein